MELAGSMRVGGASTRGGSPYQWLVARSGVDALAPTRVGGWGVALAARHFRFAPCTF